MTLAALLPGTYDNNEQVYFDRRLNRPESERHQRVLTEARRIPSNVFGPHAFFITDYAYDRDEWYPRIYSFSMDETERAIRMRIYFFTDTAPEPYRMAHQDVSILDNLAKEDLTHVPTCDVFWRPLVHGYEGTMKTKACVYELEGEQVYADFRLMLDDRSLWKGDVIRRLSDDVQVNDETEGAPQAAQGTMVYLFPCPSTAKAPRDAFTPIPMHDQGG